MSELIDIISKKDKLLDFMERYNLSGLREATEEQLKEYIEEVEHEADYTCEWIKYDYRTMCPKNHGDVDNPYWRIPTDMKHLRCCPYCGKRIRLLD